MRGSDVLDASGRAGACIVSLAMLAELFGSHNDEREFVHAVHSCTLEEQPEFWQLEEDAQSFLKRCLAWEEGTRASGEARAGMLGSWHTDAAAVVSPELVKRGKEVCPPVDEGGLPRGKGPHAPQLLGQPQHAL